METMHRSSTIDLMVTPQFMLKWNAREERKSVWKLFMNVKEPRLILRLQRISIVILKKLRQRSRN
jgi:hypothetical protein